MPAAESLTLHTPLWGTSARTCPPVVDSSCDVLVIGAGVVGLTTALAALRAGASVIIADSQRIGAGTSASTPGVASVLHGTTCQLIEECHGSDAVVTYVEELTRALAFIRAEAHSGGVPTLELASHAVVEDGHTAHLLHRERFALRPAGLNPIADDAPGLPFPTRPSIRIDDALALQPRLYTEALSRAVVAGGGLVFEGSRLDLLRTGSPATAHFTGRDEDGRRPTPVVRARPGVLATGLGKITESSKKFLLACFHFEAATGFAASAMKVMRFGGLIFVLVGGFLLIRSIRSSRLARERLAGSH